MTEMQIWHHPEIARPPGYAQLLCQSPYVVGLSDTCLEWYGDEVVAEYKEDELSLNLDLRYKLDIPGPCWAFWGGTQTNGVRVIKLQKADSKEILDQLPDSLFEPIRPGINEMRFVGEGEPELPDPEPELSEPEPETPEPLPARDHRCFLISPDGANVLGAVNFKSQIPFRQKSAAWWDRYFRLLGED